MTISTEGAWGTAASETSSSSLTFTTATTALSAETHFGLLIVVSENADTTDGETNLHTSVTGGTGAWTKLGEHTNSNGVAGSGVTTSLWLFEATGSVPTATDLTVNFGSAITHKCASGHVFTKDSGKNIRVVPGSTRVLMGTDGVAGYGSAEIAGLASKQYLFARGLGKISSNNTNITATSGYGTFAVARSASSGGWNVRGERRVVTTTAQTSAPTYAETADTSSVFVALEEFTMAGLAGSAVGLDLSLGVSASGSAPGGGEAFPIYGLSLEGFGTSIITGSGGGEISFELASTGPVFGSLAKIYELGLAAAGTSWITGEGAGVLEFTLDTQAGPIVGGSLAGVLGLDLTAKGTSLITGEASAVLGLGVWSRATNRVSGLVILASFSREGEWKSRSRSGEFLDRSSEGHWRDRMRTGTWG